MRPYNNRTTNRLEEVAHKEGVECHIRVMEAQEDGRYFVMDVDEEPLKQPVALGFTDEQAIHSIKSHRWERYAMKGAPRLLESAPSRIKSGKRIRLF